MKKKYDFVGIFIDGFAHVQLNNKWGFINKTGEEITEIKYDSIYYFHNGYAIVVLNGKYGVIDEVGNEIIECIYDNIDNLPTSIPATKLSDSHIETVARKKALSYSYANEYQYEMFVKAIIEGAKFARKMLSKE